MAAARRSRRKPARKAPALSRTHAVWASLVAAMTLVGGLLLILENNPARAGAAVALAGLESSPRHTDLSAVFSTSRPVEPGRWAGIVIHHSGSASGSAETITRQHIARGHKGLGYHFVISNGQGAPDGRVFVGHRWQDQLPGAHVSGPQAEVYNRQTIGICLVGDGERREFTEKQLQRLAQLVRTLQERLDIPDRNVVLHREVAPTADPGRLFPEIAFRQLLADAR